MERKHFETIFQKVHTTVLLKQINNKTKTYDYKIVKLPATFINKKTELWDPRTKKGKFFICEKSGGSGRIVLKKKDFPGLKVGDMLVAQFTQ